MAEHYLNVLTVRLRGYAGHPVPENLTEAMSLTVTVGAQLDLELLADDLRGNLAAGPRRIQQTYTETSWGASGSGALLVVDVPTVVVMVLPASYTYEPRRRMLPTPKRTIATRPSAVRALRFPVSIVSSLRSSRPQR